MPAVFGGPGTMRSRQRRRRLDLLPVSFDSQRKLRESNEYEQDSARRGNGPVRGAGTQGGMDRRPRRRVTHIRVGMHRVGSGAGVTIRQR
jgi:hypothetical protein